MPTSVRWAALLLLFDACVRRPPDPGAEREAVRRELDLWRRLALGPADVAPPSLDQGPRVVADDAVTARATLVRPEDEGWNGWTDGTSRLFNNAAAVVVELEVTADGPLAWVPARTSLEVNDARLALPASPSAEPLLTDLLFHAWLEERWSLEGDLSERTRAAGPFRAAYLPSRSEEGRLAGVIAFPLGEHGGDHVVALRLTLGLEVDGEPRELRLVFD